jgi:CBS domain-containing protein
MDLKKVQDQHRRSVLKTLSWRFISTVSTMLSFYLLTRRLDFTVGVGFLDIFLRTPLYFFHERVWNRSTFGKTLSVNAETAVRSPPLTVLPNERISSVIEKMVYFDIGAAIVSNGDDILGLVTERDILERILMAGKSPSKIFTKDIMSSPVLSAEYSKKLMDMLNKMRSRKVRRLVITEYGKLKGIITERRIFEALA